MGLEDIYKNNVNKSPIHSSGLSSSAPVTRQRDPQQIKLEQDVFSKMNEITTPEIQNNPKDQPVQTLQSVGLEQALKELLNGTESIDDKS